MIKKNKKNNKKKKRLIPYGKKELIFNVLSLVIAIGVGLYFGGRSFYYYSKQAFKIEKDSVTLNGTITNSNYTVTEGDGLHQDTDGYYFKGNVDNNYVTFANRTFRIIRVNNDGSVKAITDSIATEFMWGEDSNYVNSNLDNWLDKKEKIEGSGVYYDTIPYVSDFLVKTEYNIPTFDGKSVTAGEEKLSSYVSTLSIKDYSNANGKNSFLNISKYFWLIGVNESGNNLYVSEDGSLLDGNLYESYGIRPVITFKPDLLISSGVGTKDDPYVVDQGEKVNMVDNYVMIGNDKWIVYYDKGNLVKVVFAGFVGDKTVSYSNTNSEYDPTDKKSAAHYLNSLFNNYPYKKYFNDLTLYTGEVSSDTSLDFTNIYSSYVTVGWGMPNLFDYNNSGNDEYYLSNTVSTVGSNVLVYRNYGLLEEASVKDIKNIAPIGCISKDKIEKDKKGIYRVR